MQLNNNASLQSEINVTPLVDVVLVLLIIFMVVVPLLLQGYDVDMPRSSLVAEPVQAVESQVILSIGPASCRILEPPAGEGLPADCRVTLADQQIPAADDAVIGGAGGAAHHKGDGQQGAAQCEGDLASGHGNPRVERSPDRHCASAASLLPSTGPPSTISEVSITLCDTGAQAVIGTAESPAAGKACTRESP